MTTEEMLADRLQDAKDNQPQTEMRLVNAVLLQEVINALRLSAAPPPQFLAREDGEFNGPADPIDHVAISSPNRLNGIPAAGVDTVWREAAAEIIYDRMRLACKGEMPAWVPRGNAIFQDAARVAADKIAALQSPAATALEMNRLSAQADVRAATIEECAKASEEIAKGFRFSYGAETSQSAAINLATQAIRALASQEKQP